MPVKSVDSECSDWALETYGGFDEFESISSDDLLSTGSLPSDDIWKKFEFFDLPFAELSQSSSATSLDGADSELEPLLEWSLDHRNMYSMDMMNGCGGKDTANEIRHHDCMWAGHCGSKEHKPESIKVSRPLLNQTTTTTSSSAGTPTPVTKRPPVVPTSGRSLLLSSRNNPQNQSMRPTAHQQTNVNPSATTAASITTIGSGSGTNTTTTSTTSGNVGPRPDSPPSSDDDDHPRFKHEITLFEQSAENKTLQFLNDAISECDFDEDSDLCDYFEDSDMLPGGGETTDNSPCSYPGESDHSYHKGKGAQLRTDHLGVQTPSDSEEEIDVVSVGEKQQTTGRNCNTVLPTNPSIRDRQKLQRTVATAISNKREYTQPQSGGIKTRLPLRIPNTNLSATQHQERNTTIKKTSSTSGGSSSSSSSSSSGSGSGSRNDNRRGVKRGRHRYQKQSPGGSPAKRRGYAHSSDSDTECSEKRSLHNNMERQRRVDLRNAFDDLRVLVPEVACKERAAKVVILREAAAYCDFLGSESANQLKQVAELRRQQERLRARVSQLRRSLAAKR